LFTIGREVCVPEASCDSDFCFLGASRLFAGPSSF
jgi:hypothetical protein